VEALISFALVCLSFKDFGLLTYHKNGLNWLYTFLDVEAGFCNALVKKNLAHLEERWPASFLAFPAQNHHHPPSGNHHSPWPSSHYSSLTLLFLLFIHLTLLFSF
jgi:hypothetical protein